MKIIRLTLFQASVVFIGLLFPTLVFGQSEIVPAINWLTFEQAKALSKETPKPLMVFCYKPNDDSSKLMLKTTFSRKEVIAYTNAKFYPVKLDVSSKEDITFMDGKVYKKDAANPYHSLATLLLGDKPVAPTILLYDDQNTGYSFKGYRKYYELLSILVYISENVQKTSKYEIWAPAYFRTFPPEKKVNHIPLVVNWIPLKEALQLNRENPKGIFLTFYTKNSAASSVMLVNAFSHNKVAEYLNEHFYCVRIDAQTSDTLIWDKQYLKTGTYNDMAQTFMKGQMQFPSIFYFDKSNKLILTENLYLSPEALYLLSNYVVSGSYKTKAFADFMKTFKFEFNDIVPREHPNPKDDIKQ